MQGPVRERWQILCEQAANEQDPQKLLELVQEINKLLEEKQKRLNTKRPIAADRTDDSSRRL